MSGDHGSSVISAEVRHVEALLEQRGLLGAGGDRHPDRRVPRRRHPRQRRARRRPRVDRPRVRRAAARGRQRGPARARAVDGRRPAGAAAEGGREHRRAAQRHRLHAVLLLPDRPARPVADLVQERGLPLAGGPRSARRAARVRPRRCRRTSGSRCGTPARSRATWCCRAGRRAPRTSTRPPWPGWSRARDSSARRRCDSDRPQRRPRRGLRRLAARRRRGAARRGDQRQRRLRLPRRGPVDHAPRSARRGRGAGCAIGAQVSYRDLAGFGRRCDRRRPRPSSRADVLYQLGALRRHRPGRRRPGRATSSRTARCTTRRRPRGQAAAVVGGGASTYDPALPVLGLPGSALLRAGRRPPG